MRKIKIASILILSLAIIFYMGSILSSLQELLENYRIDSIIMLSENSNGFNGQLQLLVDKSLPSQIKNYSPNEDTAYHMPALLRMVDSTGRVYLVDTLARPVAWIDSDIVLRPDPQWKAITIDYSTGMGSYNGPVTSFLRVVGGKLAWLEAFEGTTKHKIELLKSTKTDWRINQGSQANIFVIECRPLSEHNGEFDFYLIYYRYYKKGNHWERVERKEKGFWELEYPESFPRDSCFNF